MRRGVASYIGLLAGLCLGIAASFVESAVAARNSAGTHSLPSSPVVAGTTITAANENAFRSDISSEITSSLDRSGRGSMLASLKLFAGTSSAPGVAFSADTDTGIYRAGSNDIRFVVDGVAVEKWTTTGTQHPYGLTCTQSTANANGITSTANGTGHGISSTGGSNSGNGGNFLGGASNGKGVAATGDGTGAGGFFTGGDTDGTGVTATGGATNGSGVVAQGTGAGLGVSATGGATNGSGVSGTAIGTGTGVLGTAGNSSGYGVKGVSGAATNLAACAGVTTHNNVAAILGDSTGAQSYAVVASADTSSPVKAALRLVPQDTAPSSPGEGDIYANSATDTLNYYNGTAWYRLHMGLSGTLTHDFTDGANDCSGEVSATVTGAAVGDACLVTSPDTVSTLGQLNCRVSATNTVQVVHCCNKATGCDPASAVYQIRIFK